MYVNVDVKVPELAKDLIFKLIVFWIGPFKVIEVLTQVEKSESSRISIMAEFSTCINNFRNLGVICH